MRRSSANFALLLALLVGCGIFRPPVGEPWEEPVPGAVAVTEWVEEGQPGPPFGAGAGGQVEWASAEQLLDAMVQALVDASGAAARGEIAGTNESGTVIAWIRLAGADEDGVVATDLRLELRDDSGSWVVVNLERRDHCGRELVDGACPSPS